MQPFERVYSVKWAWGRRAGKPALPHPGPALRSGLIVVFRAKERAGLGEGHVQLPPTPWDHGALVTEWGAPCAGCLEAGPQSHWAERSSCQEGTRKRRLRMAARGLPAHATKSSCALPTLIETTPSHR